jgi:hypothetical protein
MRKSLAQALVAGKETKKSHEDDRAQSAQRTSPALEGLGALRRIGSAASPSGEWCMKKVLRLNGNTLRGEAGDRMGLTVGSGH